MSDLGMRRMNNQDALAVVVTSDVATWITHGHLMMVADGMGAHAAGELASKLAVDNIPHAYFKHRHLYPPMALREAIREANSVIYAKGQSGAGFQGMGTTCSCLVLLPQGALIAHIGDSRVYRLRGHCLEQLTFDHSLVWEMAAAAHMAERDVPDYIPKNVITRSLGPHATAKVDLEGPYSVEAGDVFLICSDGLSGQLNDEEMGALLSSLTIDEAVQTMVDLANLRGGPDNISIVIGRVVGEEPPDVDSVEAPAPPMSPASGLPMFLWMVVVVCVVALGYCLWHEYGLGAAISAACLATSLTLALVSRRGSTTVSAMRSIGGPYGNGPYREVECKPDSEVVSTLADQFAALRELPKETGNWSVDWEPLDACGSKAVQAADAGDYTAALRHYCEAIRGFMKQAREKQDTVDPKPADSPDTDP